MERTEFKFEVERLVRHKTNSTQWLIIHKRWVTPENQNMYTCSWLSSIGRYREQFFCEYELVSI